VTVLLTIAAIVTVAGALVAITGRDARVAVIGLVVTLAAAPFLADPLPTWPALATRVVAALLGGYLLFMVLRDTTAVTRGSLVGLPAETLAAAAAFVVGYGTNGLGSAPLGPAAASATGFALAVIAVAPIVRGADVFRLGVALAVLVTGAELVRVGLAGTPPPLEQLMTAGLTIGLLGTAAVLCVNGVAATGGLTLRNEPRRSALFEAHPIAPTAPSSLRPTWLRRRTRDTRPAERPTDAHRVGPPPASAPTTSVAERPEVPTAQVELWPPDAGRPADRPTSEAPTTDRLPPEALGLADRLPPEALGLADRLPPEAPGATEAPSATEAVDLPGPEASSADESVTSPEPSPADDAPTPDDPHR
jgi:hypothetical protein